MWAWQETQKERATISRGAARFIGTHRPLRGVEGSRVIGVYTRGPLGNRGPGPTGDLAGTSPARLGKAQGMLAPAP